MLIDKKRYKESLSDLWHVVFGDDYSFIELIFGNEYEEDILCFAELEDEKAVGAFYLIKNTLKFNDELFEGFYLYAAATLPEKRKNGLMSKLIYEAQEYCRANGFDYISLVPSGDSLYSYYSRFGFKEAMYRVESKKADLKKSLTECEIFDQADCFFLRSSYSGNIMNYTKESFGYAFECLRNAEAEFLTFSSEGYLIYLREENTVLEFISLKKDIKNNIEKLVGIVKDNDVTVYSPYELNGFSSNKIKRYGMLYPINKKLERDWKYTDIYMNIALD